GVQAAVVRILLVAFVMGAAKAIIRRRKLCLDVSARRLTGHGRVIAQEAAVRAVCNHRRRGVIERDVLYAGHIVAASVGRNPGSIDIPSRATAGRGVAECDRYSAGAIVGYGGGAG